MNAVDVGEAVGIAGRTVAAEGADEGGAAADTEIARGEARQGGVNLTPDGVIIQVIFQAEHADVDGRGCGGVGDVHQGETAAGGGDGRVNIEIVYFRRIIGTAEKEGGAGGPAQGAGHRDIAVPVGDGDVGVVVEGSHNTGRGSGIDVRVRRVQQPAAAFASGRSGVDAAGDVQEFEAGGLDPAAVAAGRAAPGGDAAVEFGRIVGPYRHLTAVAVSNCVGVDRCPRRHRGPGGVVLRPPALEVAADQRCPAAAVPGDVHLRSVIQADGIAQYFHRAARLSGALAGGVQRAAVGHHPVDPAVQDDLAVNIGNASRPDLAAVIDHCPGERVRRLGGHDHLAAVRLERGQLFVFRQGAQGRLVDRQADQGVAVEIKGDLIAGPQGHSAPVGNNDPFIGYLRAEQGDIAAVGGPDASLVNHTAAIPTEGIVAGQKIAVGKV